MKILLTGASGFLGKEFIKYSKYKDIISVYNKNYIDGGYKCDLSNAVEVEKMLNNLEFDAIVHLAGNPNPGYTTEILNQYVNGIINPCINLCEFLKEDKKVVFCSSISIYEKSLYGRLKKICEDMFIDCLPNISILRPCAILGNGMTHGAAYDIIKKLKGDSKNLNLISNSSKPYVYITDVIKAIEHCLNKNELVNVFPDDNIPVLETASIIMDKLNIYKKIVFEKHSDYKLAISNKYNNLATRKSREAVIKFCENI